MRLAIVTGASSGMGMEFAREIVRREKIDAIWLIARRIDRLEALSKELIGLKEDLIARPISIDLTKKNSIDLYRSLLEEEKPTVSVLVNGSGFGKFGRFESIGLNEYNDMIDLNAKALVQITYLTLPYMTKGSEIYHIDSLSSFQPVPYINVYGATKAFVLSFSRALNAELKEKGISSMAVCPGWVNTEFFSRAVEDDTVSYYSRIFEPKEVIARAFRDMKRRRDLSICGFSTRLQVFATKLLPHRLVMKIWIQQQKKTKNTDKIKK